MGQLVGLAEEQGVVAHHQGKPRSAMQVVNRSALERRISASVQQAEGMEKLSLGEMLVLEKGEVGMGGNPVVESVAERVVGTGSAGAPADVAAGKDVVKVIVVS